jgi:hypothetical protein
MINVTTIRWQGVPVIDRHRQRSAVGDFDQYGNRFNRGCADGSPLTIMLRFAMRPSLALTPE